MPPQPLVFASFVLGTMAEYQQSVGLYSLFSLSNGILGVVVFFFHCTANESVRNKLGRLKNR